MKRFQMFFAIMIVVALLCVFFTGCTPDEAEQTASHSLPVIESQSQPVPSGNGGADPQTPPSETGSQQSDPAQTGEDPNAGNQTPEEQTSAEQTDEDDMEIVSEYTFEVGEGVGIGVGGN